MDYTISNSEGTFLTKQYHDYIASNLSEFGCVIFPEETNRLVDLNLPLNLLREDAAYLGHLDKVVLQVADSGDGSIHRYNVIVNCENRVSPFGFFDAVRITANRLGLGEFYACDFHADAIFEITASQIIPYGRLKDLVRLLDLNSNRHLCVRHMKWCAPPGYVKYLQSPRVFRNDAEKVYYEKYKDHLERFKVFYSRDECKNHFDQSTNTFHFGYPTVLEFDIDDPYLTINAGVLKTRNLNIKSLCADTVYCSHLRCVNFQTDQIYAEGIECQKYTADAVHTNIRYGLKINPNLERQRSNQTLNNVVLNLRSLGAGYQYVLARFVDSHNKAVYESHYLFINHLSPKHANNLKHEHDFTHIRVVDNPLTIEEQIKFFQTQYPDYAHYDLELWHIKQPRAAYFHTTKDIRLIKIYDKNIRRENEN